ncbi:MAG: hypothetical protein K0R41_1792 [Geminicoccaceae bacterium]|nr:hypothetical protein [Microvirga sp.]MCE3247967.1 hypothetical protein [Geminicoccaceae bacterium]
MPRRDVDLARDDLADPLLDADDLQTEPRAVVEEQIDVAPGAILVAADRAEQEQPLHAFGAQLTLVRLQQRDDLLPTEHALSQRPS